MTALI